MKQMPEHAAALEHPVLVLGRELELGDGLVDEPHLLVGDAEVVAGVVVLLAELLVDALLELLEDVGQPGVAEVGRRRRRLLLHRGLRAEQVVQLLAEIEPLALRGGPARLGEVEAEVVGNRLVRHRVAGGHRLFRGRRAVAEVEVVERVALRVPGQPGLVLRGVVRGEVDAELGQLRGQRGMLGKAVADLAQRLLGVVDEAQRDVGVDLVEHARQLGGASVSGSSASDGRAASGVTAGGAGADSKSMSSSRTNSSSTTGAAWTGRAHATARAGGRRRRGRRLVVDELGGQLLLAVEVDPEVDVLRRGRRGRGLGGRGLGRRGLGAGPPSERRSSSVSRTGTSSSSSTPRWISSSSSGSAAGGGGGGPGRRRRGGAGSGRRGGARPARGAAALSAGALAGSSRAASASCSLAADSSPFNRKISARARLCIAARGPCPFSR